MSTHISEKGGLLPTAAPPAKGRRGTVVKRLHLVPLLLLASACYYYGWSRTWTEDGHGEFDEDIKKSLCPQQSPLTPSKHADLWESLGETYETKAFQDRAVQWLSGAVQVPTESFDQMDPVGVDPRWDAFGPFHDYLLSAFPEVHATLKLTKVNTWGLVYEWVGSDPSLKPVLLAAHQDVVPVNPETVGEWTHEPFSGDFDGERIHGRGSVDDKSGLISILVTIETLIQSGFKPARKVVLAFGFDEEVSGYRGAGEIAKYLEQTYGKDAFAFLIDEGGEYMTEYGQAFATVGTAEKGYSDVRLAVASPGGHSSIPPDHTTIGILSAMIVQLEAKPAVPKLGRGTPMYQKSQCLAAYAKDIPKSLRKALHKAEKSDKALREAEKALLQNKQFKALVGTTLAIDIVQGGVKTNALPESAFAVLNHRIATDSSVRATWEHDTKTLEALASQFNLSFTAFGKQVSPANAPAYGTVTLSDAWGLALDPAPITPTSKDAAPFVLLAGTIKATHNAVRKISGDGNVVVSPGIMSGNTDTRHYWNLTKHIFRWGNTFATNGWASMRGHTVNEALPLDSYLEIIRFFTTLILNADESTAL
ncbi:carboxypeptidase S [Trametopsis cervina]|nr:carboxypeptidase S [Trametopsis cervina]